MRYVSASDAKQKLAALLDAAQREPVMIRGRSGMWRLSFPRRSMCAYAISTARSSSGSRTVLAKEPCSVASRKRT